MNLSETHPYLVRELSTPAAVATFQKTAADRAALDAFERPTDVVAFLARRPRVDIQRREAVVRALVVEAQRAPRGPWRTLLLVAFRPMLIKLVGSIRGDALDPDDLEQTAIVCFLETVASLALARHPDRTAMHLRQETRRAVLRVVRAEQDRRSDHAEVTSHAAARSDEWDPIAECPSGTESDRDELVETLDAHLRAELDGPHRELILRTTIDGEKLSRVVAEAHPELSEEERSRVYYRTKRRRERALGRVTASLQETIAQRDSEAA